MAVGHYENFPVASLLLPARLRPAVAAIYRFARGADDIADEGDLPPQARLAGLAAYGAELDRIAAGLAPVEASFAPLAAAIRRHALPVPLFHDLLSAFAQDVGTKRYATYVELRDYCRRSANPVGRLLLALYQAGTEENLARSDAICTALQEINFWQDIAIDVEKGRIYAPLEDLRRFGITERDWMERGANLTCHSAWKDLLAFEVSRSRALMLQGAPLALALGGRAGFELRLVVQGGLRILEKIERADYDVFRKRPVLRAADWAIMLVRAVTMRA